MPAKGSSLDSWLQYISSVHPREIELGLDRVKAVAGRLDLVKPASLVVTVAGTNGKGSCVASMEGILRQAGISTVAYTSPHIHRFNERIRIEGACVAERFIVAAFERIEQAREDESLSYFEFATLAALLLFEEATVDVALLEVGLGGRLDAVNIVHADVAVISSIGIDHTDWLGNDIESIAAEKAGIMRPETAVVFGGDSVPKAIVEKAVSLNSRLYAQGYEFGYSEIAPNQQWCWYGKDVSGASIELPGLPVPRLALPNVSTALQALQLLPCPLKPEEIRRGLSSLRLAARFELRKDSFSGRTVIFDAAHNADAMQFLAVNLTRYRLQNQGIRRVAVVLAVMADKDVAGMLTALESCVDIWYIAQVGQARSMAAAKVTQTMKIVGNRAKQQDYQQFETVKSAYKAACGQSDQQDIVLVTGSFFTVAEVHSLSQQA